jgi:hypothetical protein
MRIDLYASIYGKLDKFSKLLQVEFVLVEIT